MIHSFLQVDSSIDPGLIKAFEILLLIAAVIASIYICRAIFSIGTIVRNAKAQTGLLIDIARKLGVAEEDIKKQSDIAEEP